MFVCSNSLFPLNASDRGEKYRATPWQTGALELLVLYPLSIASLPGLTQPFKGSESQAVNINFQDSGKLSISAGEAFPGEFAAEPSASASTMVSGIKI